ncbi:uncharacterized protein FYW49_002033 [Xenentodon cancila]
MFSPTSMPPGHAPFMPTKFDPANMAAAGGIKPPEESAENPSGDQNFSPDIGTGNQLGSPVAPVMTLPNPGVMQGPPRPGMPPMQPPPGMLSPHTPPFLSSPNIQHMPPQMMPAGPMFQSNRFRMQMPFPPRGPPFQRYPSMGPESMNDGEDGHFQNGQPQFGCPPFERGRW